jgi:spore germination protein GerM
LGQSSGEAAAPAKANPPGEGQATHRTITAFFLHPQVDGLVPIERRILAQTRLENQLKQAIDQLTIAPNPSQALLLWPANTYLRELYLLADGTVVVDFDSGFLRQTAAGATRETLMVISLVHTLLESFPEFQQVAFLVDGRVVESLLGHVDVERPLRPASGYLVLRKAPGGQPEQNDGPEAIAPVRVDDPVPPPRSTGDD